MRAASLAIAIAVAIGAPPARADAANDAASAPLTGESLERALSALDSPDPDTRRRAVDDVGSVGEGSLPAIEAALASVRARDVDPRPAMASAHGSTAIDRAHALAALAPSGAGYALALRELSLLAACARVATPEAARLLVAASPDAGFAYRGMITRALLVMDDRAVAALVVAKRGRSAPTRGWAAETLESMGKERADAQIRTRSDDVLAGILRAFGAAHDPDALGVVSSFVGSERPQIRAAARAALVDYGDDASAKLRQDYADLTGQPAPPSWDTSRAARELFAASDRLRLREVYALLDEGVAHARAGDLEAAVRDFDAVLARQPDLDRRPEIIATYVAHAVAIEDRDPMGARAYLHKARRLDPESARAGEIDGELAYLDGRELVARGAPDPQPFRRALEHDPANPRARAALDRIEADTDAGQARLRRWTAIAVGAVGAIALAVLFLGRGRASRRGRRQAGT